MGRGMRAFFEAHDSFESLPSAIRVYSGNFGDFAGNGLGFLEGVETDEGWTGVKGFESGFGNDARLSLQEVADPFHANAFAIDVQETSTGFTIRLYFELWIR